MADQAESSRRAPPMTPPPPPPAFLEDSNSEAIPWAASDDCSSSTPHTDLLSLWLSNYTALPQSEAEEEPLADVPTLLNFDLESSFPDLVDWNTNSTAVTQAPIVTQPLWVQLYATAEGEVDALSRQAFGIQSPQNSISPLALGIQSTNNSVLPLALGIQFPEASVSPPALGIQLPAASFEIQSPEDPMSQLSLGIQLPPASSGIDAPQASLSALTLGLQPPPASFRTQSPQAPISPLAPGIQSSISPLSLGIQSPQISFGIQSAPAPFSSLPPIPCTLFMVPLLRNLSSIPSTLPMAPPLWNFLTSPSPVPERRSWSVFPSTPPPARRKFLLLPHSASASVSSPSSHPSHQAHHYFPTPNTEYQQQGPAAHAPVTFSTPNAKASFFGGFVPASRPSWSQAMAPRRGWTPNQPWISNGQDMKLPLLRHPRFLLPPVVATMHAPFPLLANCGSSEGNMPSWTARRDHQRVETGESSRPLRKRSKLAV